LKRPFQGNTVVKGYSLWGEEAQMKRVSAVVLALATILLGLLPSGGAAGSATQTFLLVAEAPNLGVAANGDRVEVTCATRHHECGTFQAHPKALPDPPSGEFVHKRSDGSVVASGTWRATELISFHFYGCRFIPALGADLGSDDLCGGAVKMRVDLITPAGTLPAILTVFCIVGPKAPASHNTPAGEGVTLNVPGVINFNHPGGGENIYIKQ
jgi:hypothetical protein